MVQVCTLQSNRKTAFSTIRNVSRQIYHLKIMFPKNNFHYITSFDGPYTNMKKIRSNRWVNHRIVVGRIEFRFGSNLTSRHEKFNTEAKCYVTNNPDWLLASNANNEPRLHRPNKRLLVKKNMAYIKGSGLVAFNCWLVARSHYGNITIFLTVQKKLGYPTVKVAQIRDCPISKWIFGLWVIHYANINSTVVKSWNFTVFTARRCFALSDFPSRKAKRQ